MKKIVIASVLASATMAVSSYGQGLIAFQNYNFGATSLNAPVTFSVSGTEGGSPVQAGWGVGSSFAAAILYEYGTMTSYAPVLAAESGSPSYPERFAFGAAGNGPVDATSTFAGYFFGNTIQIPGYTSGSISFIIQAFDGSDYASSAWNGQSDPFTVNSIATGTTLPTDLAFNGFTVSPVPEPTTLALAGLGGLASLVAFRRKQS